MTIKKHGGIFGRNPSFNDASVQTLSIGGTAISSTAAELNILDGVTSNTAELNILDGVTSTTAELNILDGVTADATELNYLDGASTSVVTASKAVLANASANIAFASGQGIDFSATAGTGTSELLSDYEEGTWTPALTSTGATFSYAAQYGIYTKVGRQVTASFRFYVSASGTVTNATTVSGLPFTSSSTYGMFYSGFVSAATTTTFPSIYMQESATALNVIEASTLNSLTPTDLGMNVGNKWFIGTIIYFT